MKDQDPIVFVIDDDRMIREGMQSLIRSVGLRVEMFASAQDFLDAKRPDAPACLVLDVRMPGLSGLDLQLKLRDGGIPVPIIFITGIPDQAGAWSRLVGRGSESNRSGSYAAGRAQGR
jgi:FixJ family two-component response regulator